MEETNPFDVVEGVKTFLPMDYQVPQSPSRYMKFEEGDNLFRALGSPVIGWEDWTEDRKPMRFRMADKPKQSMTVDGKIKHFWAFPVWNYGEKQIQILEITQAGIQNSIKNLTADVDWGSPFDYDIKVTRKGKGIDTEYETNPKPKKELDPTIVDLYSKGKINMEALFSGGDPFQL